MPGFNYTAYGLNILSELECPELLPGNGGEPDVLVRCGSVPAELENPGVRGIAYQATPEKSLLKPERIARYLVSNGREILIDRDPDVDDASIRVFLLGPALAALLHQRGFLPLHGSAIETEKGAVIFAGPSGCGKSTLAGAFLQRGYPILADDICAICRDQDGISRLQPAFPQIKLWADTAQKIGVDVATMHRLRPHLDKFALRLGERFSLAPLPIRAIYLLSIGTSQEISVTPITGSEKLKALACNIYAQYLVRGMDLQSRQFILAIAVANNLHLRLITRPERPLLLEQLVELLEKDWA